MDKLKSLLASKKPQSKITIQKHEIQKQKQSQQKRQKQLKQKQQQQKQKKLQQIDEFYAEQYGKKKIKVDEMTKMTIPLTEDEVKEKLKQLYQPQTLENESEEARYKRLLKYERIHQEYPELDMRKFDMQFYHKLKEKQYYEHLDTKYHSFMIEPKLCENIDFREKKLKQILQQKQKDHYTDDNFGVVCDLIYLWLVKIFKEWKQRQQQKYSKEENARNNVNIQRYQDNFKEMKGFMKVLKSRAGDKEMIISVYNIMNCCLVREYVQANDKYIELSIGKAPWPMGVAMLGITVKRNAHRLSHVLNDEMTRRWMQGIKRLITLSQELFPNEQVTKMVHLSVNSMI